MSQSSIYDQVRHVAVAEDSTALYHSGHGMQLESRWMYSVALLNSKGDPVHEQELGGFQSLHHFLQMNNNISLKNLPANHRLQLFRSGITASEGAQHNLGGGKFSLRNRYSLELDAGKIWHLLGLAMIGCQIEYCYAVTGATVTVVNNVLEIDVWVGRCNEMAINALKHSLGQIVAMTEGQDACVIFQSHVQPVQPRQPVPSRRAPPGHRKSRSNPQTVDQSFLDKHENETLQKKRISRTDASKDAYIPKQSISAYLPEQNQPSTKVGPPPGKKEIQTPPPFVSRGKVYPAGLSRKQRRSVQFHGMQGHQEVETIEGFTPLRDLPDGPITEELFAELLEGVEVARERKPVLHQRSASIGDITLGTVATDEEEGEEDTSISLLRRCSSYPTLESTKSSFSSNEEDRYESAGFADVEVLNWADDYDC